MSSRFALTLLTSCVLAACSGSETETPEEETNTAPIHNGDLVYALTESDNNITIDLLEGSSDSDNDQLSITNLVANSNNPNKGVSTANDSVAITPSEFIDDLEEGESIQILFTFDITDGDSVVARQLTVTITGESVIVENNAPTHTGDLTYAVNESSADFTINLLEGTADLDGDDLTITELTASANNPSVGVSIDGNDISISPSSFADTLAESETAVISYTFKVTDGESSTERTLTVTVTGESGDTGNTGGTNEAPTHSGDIDITANESDGDLTIDLLEGTYDSDGDQLEIINLVAGQNNPGSGVSVSGSTIVITPTQFADALEANQSQVISYSFDVSDGSISIARQLTVTIEGESVTVEPTDGQTITVDLATEQYLGLVSILQRNKFLNMHDSFASSHNSDAVIDTYLNEYRVDHGRQFWTPMSAAKNHLDANGTYPTTASVQAAGPQNIANYYANSRNQLISNRTVVTDHPSSVIRTNNDPIDGARYAADYYEFYYDDTSRPIFFEPMNEPFVHAGEYTDLYGSQEEVRAHMTQWFKEIGKQFDQRAALADVNIIGFASAWPSLEMWDFGHWESRMGMFMDEAGEHMDAFSTHLYDGINIVGASSERSGSNSQAILDLIETYSHYKWDTVKPHAITEYGAIVDRPDGELEYDEVVNGQTMRSFNHIMLELMQREDRVLMSIPFLTGYASWYWQSPSSGNGHPYNPSLWRPNPDNIELVNNKWEFKDVNASDNYLVNINSYFLEFWKDVDGRRALVTENDPDIQTAAFVNDEQAFVIISNLEHETKAIDFDIKDISDRSITSIKLERLDVPRDTPATLTSDTYTVNQTATNNNLQGDQITLEAGETVKYTITFDQSIPINNTAQRQSYYADEHLVSIVGNQALTFNINSVELETANTDISSALLRMSIGRKHDKSKQPTLTVNGNTVQVPDDWAGYDQAGRDDFFGAIEIPVPFEYLATNNVISVTFPDSDGRVSSMILDVNNEIDAFTVDSITLTGEDRLYVGTDTQILQSITPEFLSNSPLTWTSSDNSIATVTDGLVTGVSVGNVTIIATAANGVSAEHTLAIETISSNLLNDANGDFEQALDDTVIMTRSSTGQINEATFSISADAAKDGNGGLLVDNSAGSMKIQFTPTSIIQNVDTSKTYEIKADVKVVSGTHILWTEIENAAGGWKNSAIADSNDWQSISTQYSGSDLGSNFGLNFHLDPQSDGSGGIIYVDNVTVTAIE